MSTAPQPTPPAAASLETKRERKNRFARERRARRKSYNSDSKYDRLYAYIDDHNW